MAAGPISSYGSRPSYPRRTRSYKARRYGSRRRSRYTRPGTGYGRGYGGNPSPYNGTGVLGNMLRVPLRYGAHVYNTITGSYQQDTFKLNSCYDPVNAVGGGQPQGFDQLKTLYAKYRVVYCTMSVKVTVSAGVSGHFVLWTNCSGAAISQLDNVLGKKGVQYRLLSAGESATMRVGINPARFIGIDSRDPDLSAAVTADPASVVYGAISLFEPTNTAPGCSYQADIQLDMIVDFIQPVEVADA